jgi:hypothetical protein
MPQENKTIDLVKLMSVVNMMQTALKARGFEDVPSVYSDYAHLVIVATNAMDTDVQKCVYLKACEDVWSVATEMNARFGRRDL